MLNVIAIMGRITKPLELKTTQSGVAMLDFCIANDEDYTPKDGSDRKTNFVNMRAWRHTAEFINRNFDKGRMIAIKGRLQIDNYEDNEGNKRTYPYVLVDTAYFADSKKSDTSDTSGSATPANTDFADLGNVSDSDLPF